MNYRSTRNKNLKYSAADVIVKGISDDGGLFVPEKFPVLDIDELKSMADDNYVQRAIKILSLYLTDFTSDEIKLCAQNAYGRGSTGENFSSKNIAETLKLYDGAYMLELWHGPTCAFKDMALQLLPQLLAVSAKKVIPGKEVIILVATSGDTGKAALDGFKDMDGIKILVFYPEDGVSAMQKKQMTTQDGNNVSVCAIQGNFDDAQTGVKNIFSNRDFVSELDKHNKLLSSANSINWGRLLPQIVYYFSAYADLIKSGEILPGEKINITVPTGNFGNILAAYYAKEMGLPVNRFICASNINNILTDFINTGIYDRNREFKTTISPSMDILISSNLERLLYHMSGEDDGLICSWFADLKKHGRYEVSSAVKEKLNKEFYGGFCDDSDTKAEIKNIFDKYSYLCDTHTAVAVKVYADYRTKTGDNTKTVIASTASPYKFSSSVLEALNGEFKIDEYENLNIISGISGLKIPPQLEELKGKADRFTNSISVDNMLETVRNFINL